MSDLIYKVAVLDREYYFNFFKITDIVLMGTLDYKKYLPFYNRSKTYFYFKLPNEKIIKSNDEIFTSLVLPYHTEVYWNETDSNYDLSDQSLKSMTWWLYRENNFDFNNSIFFLDQKAIERNRKISIVNNHDLV